MSTTTDMFEGGGAASGAAEQGAASAQNEAAPASGLAERVAGLTRRAEGAAKELKALAKALGDLTGAHVANPGTLEKVEQALAKLELAETPTQADVDALREALRGAAEARRRSLRLSALGALHRAAKDAGLGCETLADSPPTLLIAPVTVTLDFDAGQAELAYAREPVAETDLDAGRILAAREAFMKETREAAIPSERFFDQLRAAHAFVCRSRGQGTEERVDLVDLLGPLSLFTVEPEKWRSTARWSAYPRHMLAYQLKNLRADGLLERDGVRLDLGAATGGTTRNKRNVLFVPSGHDQGQYYLSVRFV